ncbi:MAG: DMT family transporter [Pseudomonadota bacterium]
MIARLWSTPWLLLTCVTMMWASNAIAARLAVEQISPATLVLARWLMVAAVMSALYGRQLARHWPDIRAKLGLTALMAFLGFTAFNTVFYFAGERTTAINIGILQGAMPVVVMLGAFLAYGDRVRPVQMLGVALTLVGVVIVASKGSWEALRALAFNDGDLLMLLAALLYSAYTIALRARPEMPGAVLFTFFALIAAVTAVPLAAWEWLGPGRSPPTPLGWGVSLWVAIFPSCLAQLFFLRGVDLIGPGRAGVYINLVPIFAALFAVALLGERFAPFHGAALVLVLGGIALAQKGEAKPLPSLRKPRSRAARRGRS